MEKCGFLLINKPAGLTSHDVIDELRKITGIKKIGHSGILDPLATGLLVVGVGREATKKLSDFLKMDKEYVAKIRLGAVSETLDKQGPIKEVEVKKIPSQEEVREFLNKFIGDIEQVPPIYSAKHFKGKRLYQLARQGIKVTPEPIKVKVYYLNLLDYSWPYLKIKTKVSSGTYLRSLARDIGDALGCKGYLENLVRTKVGSFDLEQAVDLNKLNSSNWENFLKKVN